MIKGAPERVMDMCTSVLLNGKNEEVTKERRAELEKLNETLARRGERVLGFA
jgi:sodium/potassium-transporting ATPase subunit alpha